jgi:5-methyltetrahydropteroyltriglutamate--homocysteine methyltransferase
MRPYIVTDGEMRRLSFQSQVTEAIDGFGPWDINAFLWGHWHGDGAMGERRRDRPVNLGVVSRLVRKRHLAAEEFVYLRGRTSRVAKVTLPSPSLFVNFWSPERSQSAYASLEHFLADVVAVLRDEVAVAGAPWSGSREALDSGRRHPRQALFPVRRASR